MQVKTQTLQPTFFLKMALEFFLLWYLDAIVAMSKGLYSLLVIIADMFALPVLFKTLFLPYRAENRKGFIAIAIGIGFVLRVLAIATCLLLLAVVLTTGLSLLLGWALVPFLFLFLLLQPLIL